MINRDFRADGLSVSVFEQGLGHGRRSGEPVSCVRKGPVAREHGFGKEPAETGLIHFANERSHGMVMARTVIVGQADRSPLRATVERSGPLPRFEFSTD
jgi:hypothetical protein